MTGFALGFLTWMGLRVALHFAVASITIGILPLIAGLAGAVAQGRWLRGALWTLACATTLLLVVVAYTPMADSLIADLNRTDKLRRAPAVVVLAADNLEGVAIGPAAQDRLLHAFELIHGGWSNCLLLSRGSGRFRSWVPSVERENGWAGLEVPGGCNRLGGDDARRSGGDGRHCAAPGMVDSDPGDSALAHAESGGRVQEAGLHVICSPCVESSYNPHNPQTFDSRIRAFADWLHETIGIRVYQWRGWA